MNLLKMLYASCLLAITLLICTSNPCFSQTYHLTFDDEFDNLTLSNADFAGDRGTKANGTYETYYRSHPQRHLLTGEQQEFVDSNFTGQPLHNTTVLGLNPFSVTNGIATITANPSSPSDLPFLENQPYTSGMLSTFSSFNQTYGYFECRAKLPSGQGLWPAFWLLPTTLLPWGDLKWQYEIDVFECFGSKTGAGGGFNQLHWALHHAGQQGVGNWVTVHGNIYSGFHTYGVLWEAYPGNITYYFDGTAVAKTPTIKDMDQPMFMIANLTVGGSWPGPADSKSGEFPAHMNIDYIRAYSNNPNIPAVSPQVGYSKEANLPIRVDN